MKIPATDSVALPNEASFEVLDLKRIKCGRRPRRPREEGDYWRTNPRSLKDLGRLLPTGSRRSSVGRRGRRPHLRNPHLAPAGPVYFVNTAWLLARRRPRPRLDARSSPSPAKPCPNVHSRVRREPHEGGTLIIRPSTSGLGFPSASRTTSHSSRRQSPSARTAHRDQSDIGRALGSLVVIDQRARDAHVALGHFEALRHPVQKP